MFKIKLSTGKIFINREPKHREPKKISVDGFVAALLNASLVLSWKF